MSNTLVYLVYGGSRDYQLELTYSILSATRWARADAPLRIVLVSDQQSRRDDLPVEHLPFTDAEFAHWSLDGRYRHGAKPGSLLKALRHCGGKVALVDTDTWFMRDPAEIFARIGPDVAVMHQREVPVGTSAEYAGIVRRGAGGAVRGHDISAASVMYNSGVIGVQAGHEAHVEEALALTQALHLVDPAVHTVEQFAVSRALERHLRLATCGDVVNHYFGPGKHFIHCQLREMFPGVPAARLPESGGVLPSLFEFPDKKMFDLAVSKLKSLQRRQQQSYAFAYLAARSAFSARSAEYANAWARVAIDVIRANDFPRRIVAADFRRYRLSALDGYSWLEPSTREYWQRYWATGQENPGAG